MIPLARNIASKERNLTREHPSSEAATLPPTPKLHNPNEDLESILSLNPKPYVLNAES
jgi:hypothetical protein